MPNILEIKKVSITELDVDCIVNAANSRLQHGGGVCGAIFAAAGASELQRACNARGHCETGNAVITPGFRLPARYIIHAVGPVWHGGDFGEPQQLYSCYQNSLRIAMENNSHSIAFPLISSGIYGYPKRQAWEIAIQSIRDFQQAHEDSPLHVIIAVIDSAALDLGNEVLANFLP